MENAASPDTDYTYDDERVSALITSIQENVAADDLRLVREGLADLMRFAVQYYDDGVSRDTMYYAVLLTPELMQRLRQLFFHPDTNEQVARVMDSLIPENCKRVADCDFVARLCHLIAYRPVDTGIIHSVTLITYKLVVYGDADLKTEFLKQNVMQHMSTFVNEFLRYATDETSDQVLMDAMTHMLWAAGELIPVAESVCPHSSFLLYDIMKQFIQFPNNKFVRELLILMDIRCYDGHSIQCLQRQDLMANLLWTLRQRQEWCFSHNDILFRIVKIVHSLLQYSAETCDGVLDDIRKTWTVTTFFDFLIKDHTNREPAVVETAISMLSFVAADEVHHIDILPHIISFMNRTIQSDSQYGTSRHLQTGLKALQPLIRSMIKFHSDLQSVIQVMDGIFYVISQLLLHFDRDDDVMSDCLIIINDFLISSNVQVYEKVVSFLMSDQVVEQIAALGDKSTCRDASNQIISHCEKQKVIIPATDIMLLMDRMRLG